MQHPFRYLSPHRRKRYFWWSFAATIALMVILNMVGAPLNTPQAPFGIISYELAGSPSQAQEILESWPAEAKLRAAFSLGLDYLFMLAYASAISLACVWAADALRHRGWPFAGLGGPLAWGQWIAALLDALENLALTVILFSSPVSPWPEIARWSAVIKFSLVFIGLIYAFLGLIVRVSIRVKPSDE